MSYPHIISIFNEGSTCDFCSSKLSEKIEIVKNIGYYCCNSKKCKDLLLEHINKYVISLEQLKRNFGEKIKVKRSTGDIEDGWEFVSPGYVSNSKSSFVIKVRRNNSTKELRYTDIEELNNLII